VPEQLLGEITTDGRLVVCDLEAGVRTLMRTPAQQLDVLLVVAEPSAKSIEVARRAREVGRAAARRVVVVANRVGSEEELEVIRSGLEEPDLFVVPADPAITRADRAGRAAIDAAADGPGVRAMSELAIRLVADRPARSPAPRAGPPADGRGTEREDR